MIAWLKRLLLRIRGTATDDDLTGTSIRDVDELNARYDTHTVPPDIGHGGPY
jgi:hypothetical protein